MQVKQEAVLGVPTPPMTERKVVPDRFKLGRKLGQGTFSVIFEAYDTQRKENVALKIEKKDKIKTILLFEYKVLSNLQNNEHICKVYDYVENTESKQNFISMELLGNNLDKVKRNHSDGKLPRGFATFILMQMLDAIEETHRSGFIHRDIKASNFVLGKNSSKVYLVDFGLAKKHLNKDGYPIPARKKADFRGTVSFASLNAHYCIDLSRRDDLWSWYFALLDFYKEPLKWRANKGLTMAQVKEVKEECLKDPENKLWSKETEDLPEIKEIWSSIKRLEYKDEPDYNFIRGRLKQIYDRSQYIPRWNPHPYERYDDQYLRSSMEVPFTRNFMSNNDIDIAKPMGYYRDNLQPRITYPQYPAGKNYVSHTPAPAPAPEYMNSIGQTAMYNQPTMTQNYSIGLTAPPSIPHPIQTPTLPKMPLPEFEPRETNLNVSLNQILRFPYQIVVPPTAEINQSISISNLPPLNDLAIRTGINNSVSTLVHKGLCYPGGSELILPISSIYAKNCAKYPPAQREIHWESKPMTSHDPNLNIGGPHNYYSFSQRDFMPKEEPRTLNNDYNLPPPQPQAAGMMPNNMMHRSYAQNPSYCYPTVETKPECEKFEKRNNF